MMAVIYSLLLYGKASLRQIPVFRLVLSRSGFCRTDRVHGNGPTRVFLFWSEALKLKNLQPKERKKKLSIGILQSETTRSSED